MLFYCLVINTLSQTVLSKSNISDIDVGSQDLIPHIRTAYRPSYADYKDKSILQCVTSLPPPLTFGWYFNRKKIKGEKKEFLELRDFDKRRGGVFVCTIFRPGLDKPLKSKPIIYTRGSSESSAISKPWKIVFLMTIFIFY